MSGPTTNNVPKFASFRPKPLPPPDEAATKTDIEKGTHDRKNHREEERKKQRHHRTHQSRSRERKPTPAISVPAPDIDSSLFVVDRKGDVKNLIYGSIHRYSIPLFHRYGAGCVLGAPLIIRIDRDIGEEKGISLRHLRDSNSTRSREKYAFSKVATNKPRLLKIRAEVKIQDEAAREDDFIPLQRPKKRKRIGSPSGSDTDSGPDKRDYRSINGKPVHNQPEDDDFEYATESESSGSENGRTIKIDNAIRQKNVELSRRVEQSPHDIEGWVALINHQDTLLGLDNERRRITTAEMKSTAEIKIHMYEKALASSKSLSDREKLLISLMTEGAKIWNIKDQVDRWREISEQNIESLTLWRHYLDFRQSNFSTFRYDEVREVYLSRITLLSTAIAKAVPATKESHYGQLIYVILRLTLFIRESGYSELAIAIWQGLLELNFFAPKSSTHNLSTLKSLFRDFWEAEVPRIGENGALGWQHFAQNQTEVDSAEPVVDSSSGALQVRGLFGSWITAERLRTRNSRFPARTMDEVTEDDPYRVILFSDIEDYLLVFSEINDLKEALVNAFLLFCRLAPASSNNPHQPLCLLDSFTDGRLLEYSSDWLENNLFDAQDDTKMPEQSPWAFPDFNVLQNYFGLSKTHQNRGAWQDRYSEDDGPISCAWINRTLKQLTKVYTKDTFADYFLRFDYHNGSPTIKKTAKTLLKQHPASLRLYNTYAEIEWARGNKEVAQGVFSAAINMSVSNTLKDTDIDNTILLWKTWIWALLDDLNHSSALQLILSIPAGEPDSSTTLSPTVLLKCKHHLLSRREFLLSKGDFENASLYCECLVLLEYLTGNIVKETTPDIQGTSMGSVVKGAISDTRNITPALSTFSYFSQTLAQREQPDVLERFLESGARLLYLHTRTGPFRPALLREHLANFITLFPQNLVFLSLYKWNESRLRIDNRVRNILLSTVLVAANDTLSSRLFAIYYEINYGTIHSVKSAFEHALNSAHSRSSAGLWRTYILYCLRTPQFRSQAKDIWYRALRSSPWAKELYLLGFEHLRDLIPFDELKVTWRIMGEKELRVHVDLEDMFEDMSITQTR